VGSLRSDKINDFLEVPEDPPNQALPNIAEGQPVLRYLQFRSSRKWALSNMVALLRWTLLSYCNLWEGLTNPYETPPEPLLQLQFNLDSIGASG
jgi:hypothetical protein